MFSVCCVSTGHAQKVIFVIVIGMLLPSMLYLIGIEGCKYISIIHIWDVFCLIQESQNFIFVILELVCSIGVGIGAFLMARYKWK